MLLEFWFRVERWRRRWLLVGSEHQLHQLAGFWILEFWFWILEVWFWILEVWF